MFKLIEKRDIAANTMTFKFDISGTGYSFKPGQNADISLINLRYTDEEGIRRTFSFCNSPTEGQFVEFAMRLRDTAFKKNLKELSLGSLVEITEPIGTFLLHKDETKPAVFLAGGIGVAPVRSIVKWATDEKLPHRLILFYSNRNLDTTAFLQDFENLAKINPNFIFVPTLTQNLSKDWTYSRGRIDADMLKKFVPNLNEAVFYIAGSPAMVRGMHEVLEALGIHENIKTEQFDGY